MSKRQPALVEDVDGDVIEVTADHCGMVRLRIPDRDVAGADICDHLPVDPEVAAMAALAPALAAVRQLKHQEAMRVMRWATDRATGSLPPF